MRIEFKREGGLAYFPGRSKPRTIESGDLPPERVAELEARVRDARFFEQPSLVGKSPPAGADRTLYTLTLDDAGRRHSVQLVEPVEEPHLRALLNLIKQLEKERRGTSANAQH
ncbi:hypothetical protein P2318_09425 [Myxococcaceae bacterium GXIMD 01537]